MAALYHEVYTLHVYRSRASSGWQWALRLEHLPGDGPALHRPEALLAYLQAVVRATESVGPRADTLAEGDVPEEAQEEGGMQDRV